MITDTEEIKKLLASYSPDSIPQLASFVEAQAAGTTPYMFDANRTLAKLYQFSPDRQDERITALILLLAMVEFPSTDVVALSCLIPEQVQSGGACATVLRCAELLDSCQFALFWTVYQTLVDGSDSGLSSLAKRSTERLSKSIVSVLALSFRTAPLSIVTAAAHVDDANTLATYAAVEGVNGDHVQFVATLENTKRDRVFQEGVTVTDISSLLLMSKAAVANE